MAAGDLTTLVNLKAWLNISGTADDVLLARLITMATNFFLQEIGRDNVFGSSQAFSETRDGTGGAKMLLRNYPVQSLDSLVIDSVAIPQSTKQSNGWVLQPNIGAIMLYGYRFCEGYQNISIGYHAGFASIPFDVEQAVIALAGLRYRERSRIGEVSKIVGPATVSFSQKDMPDDVADTINKYQQKLPIG